MELKVLFIRTCQDEDELQHTDSIRREVHEDLKAHIDDIDVTDIFIVNTLDDKMVQDKWHLGSLRAAILHAMDQFDMTDRNLMQMQMEGIIALNEGKSSKPSDHILRALYGCPRTIKPLLPDWKAAITPGAKSCSTSNFSSGGCVIATLSKY
ncbi:uncharacterized protein LOC118424497 [Branchiostoma floridae]|uniref:Uncharacterized protein LOC118424497 n=1 Tax=Branchiostoma floridae TaxID=7739 RepID=A0A9J7LVF7_BRAFL|nr:uncharacterized protein LOC118424497 [Branchiostoma floridae]